MGQRLWHLTKENTQMTNNHVKRCSTSHVIREMQTETSRYHCMDSHLGRQFGGFSQNSACSHHVTQQSGSLISIHRRRRHFHTETCPRMFASASFITAKTWRPPHRPLAVTGRRHDRTREHHSTSKNELPSPERRGGNVSAHYRGEEAHLKRLHPVRFRLRDVLDEAQPWRQ